MNGFLIFNTQVVPIDKDPFKIGRALDNYLVIQEPNVSRHHAEIYLRGGHYIIKDLDSTGGTYINEQRITEAMLTSGDSILVAQTALVFVQNAPQLAEKAATATGPLKLPGPDRSPTRPTIKPNWRPQKDDNSQKEK